MFASKSILEHLARGAAGLGALVASAVLAPTQPWLSVALFPLALVALRGCPMCWTVGLIQTVRARLQRKSTEGLCVDGACAIRARPPASGAASSGPRDSRPGAGDGGYSVSR